ncbi:MAG: site-specific integrase, partial [Eubacteriales bacterium]|nr:site-specific integrase [Eubacteriales bacterium]
AYLPEMVYSKIMRLREMQENLKRVLGDGYFDYGMIICQANGSPVMTEHLNKRFQRVLDEMGIKPKHGEQQYVFHSIRSTSTTYKLRVSGGDIKAVQGENGQKDPKMVTHQYSRIIDEDRIRIANAMNDDFYRKDERKSEEEELLAAVKDNPELFKQFVAFVSMTKNSAKNMA